MRHMPNNTQQNGFIILNQLYIFSTVYKKHMAKNKRKRRTKLDIENCI